MKKRRYVMYTFMIPALFMLCFFVVRPFCETAYISLCSWNGYSSKKVFVGLMNYMSAFKDRFFWTAFRNSVIYGFVSTLFQNIIGLSLALFVNQKFRGNNVVRVIVYLPIMISGLIMGYIMNFMFGLERGVLNEILGFFGAEPIYWLGGRTSSVICILIVNCWQYAGNCMILYLAGLQGISTTYLEAAQIDGASGIQVFRYIKLPLLVPAMMTAVISNLIGGLKIYDIIVSFTNGGPNYATHSLMSFLTLQYFDKERAGYSAAVGIITFVFIVIVSVITNKFFESKRVEA